MQSYNRGSAVMHCGSGTHCGANTVNGRQQPPLGGRIARMPAGEIWC